MKKHVETHESDSRFTAAIATGIGVALMPLFPLAPAIGFGLGLLFSSKVRADIEEELDQVVGENPDRIAREWTLTRAGGIRHAEVKYTIESDSCFFPITRVVRYELEEGEDLPGSVYNTPARPLVELPDLEEVWGRRNLLEDWKPEPLHPYLQSPMYPAFDRDPFGLLAKLGEQQESFRWPSKNFLDDEDKQGVF